MFSSFTFAVASNNKLHITEEIIVEHKLASFPDDGLCSLPVFPDERHGFSSEMLTLKTDDGSFSFGLYRVVFVLRGVAT